MRKTAPLALDTPIVTGNTKAAIASAGGKSGDLWKVPPEELHYDPSDNVRPLNQERVRHVADLIKANGYDRKHPLGCIVRKVDGEDRIYVYEGQHRYHGALLAIAEGADLPLLPCVIDEAKSVSRPNLIYAGVTSNDSERMTPLELAAKVVELQTLGEPNAEICKRLGITDQTIRDVLLLAHAPAALHKLVRDKVVSSTLAIEEIRAHGGGKALERLTSAAAKAAESGKGKVTKKALDKAAPSVAPKKITEPQAKQLLQALQAVLHDPLFGKLSPGTIDGVQSALGPHADLLDLPQKQQKHPISKPNANDVYVDHETIKAPASGRLKQSPAQIHLAQIAAGSWISSTSYTMGSGSGSSPCSWHEGEPTYPTRVQAIRAGVSQFTRRLEDPRLGESKEAAGVRKWLDKLWTMPDPDWTEGMASNVASAGMQRGAKISAKALWPFPGDEAQRRPNSSGDGK